MVPRPWSESIEKMSGGLGNRLPKAVEQLWGEVCAVRPFNGVGFGVEKDLFEVVTCSQRLEDLSVKLLCQVNTSNGVVIEG